MWKRVTKCLRDDVLRIFSAGPAYRKHTRRFMFSQASVILSTGDMCGKGGCAWWWACMVVACVAGGGGMSGRGRGECVAGGMHGGGYVWRGRGVCVQGEGVCVAGGMHGRGHAWQSGMAGEMATVADGTHPNGITLLFFFLQKMSCLRPHEYGGLYVLNSIFSDARHEYWSLV